VFDWRLDDLLLPTRDAITACSRPRKPSALFQEHLHQYLVEHDFQVFELRCAGREWLGARRDRGPASKASD
jgi:hypothetical protein